MKTIGKTLFILMLLLLKSNVQSEEIEEVEEIEEDTEILIQQPEECNDEKQTFNGCKTPSPNTNLNWMETLNDEKLISEITIPGTHDSLALHGGPGAKCQSLSLENQLKAGIRYFDLRVSGLRLIIMHGLTIQWISLSRVLRTIKAFLTEFKSEVVLVRIKPVKLKKGSVPNLVKDMIQNYQNIWDKSTIPKIGEVRGKIVFVQKETFKQGIILFETDENGDYKVTKVTDKEEKIKQHLKEAAEKCSTGAALSLIYSSGTSLGTYKGVCLLPKSLAKEINPWLYGHLAKEFEKNPKPCFGIIAMDFPGINLIQMIIKFNTPT